ncbi:MAG: 1-acyl-sn-glycerol-3-phosphate acyltransferase [Flavobacteriales bacterium]|nr:MAG: 1-acyl-sn-glycerol-3-phosphate acyltransferase [Flavobacteriales bacterium]
MKRIFHFLSYPFTVLFYLIFGFCLVFFHGIQWVGLNFFGYQAHKKSVDILNLLILLCLKVLGTSFEFKVPKNIPQDIPIIIVSNHQSLWDIPPIIWFLRKLHPKFVSKFELGKGIPSVSYNLRHGGSILIKRNNAKQALSEMIKFSDYLSKNNRSGVIFPEGTRSRKGEAKRFQRKGLELLFKKMPEALVLPLTINNSWKLQRYGMFPMPLGVKIKYILHPLMKVSDFETDVLIDKIEMQIKSDILPK